MLIDAAGAVQQEIAVTQRAVLLGRSSRAEILVDSPQVSRIHAQIINTPDGFYLADLGSTNGTLHNGRRVRPKTLQKLNSNDQFRLGDVALLFQIVPATVPKVSEQSLRIPTQEQLINAWPEELAVSGLSSTAVIERESPELMKQAGVRLAQASASRLKPQQTSLVELPAQSSPACEYLGPVESEPVATPSQASSGQFARRHQFFEQLRYAEQLAHEENQQQTKNQIGAWLTETWQQLNSALLSAGSRTPRANRRPAKAQSFNLITQLQSNPWLFAGVAGSLAIALTYYCYQYGALFY